jgi:hypothetical protein
MSTCGTENVTVMIAALSSSATWPLAYLSNGPETDSTCGSWSNRLALALIAFLAAAERTDSPSRGTTTT